MMNDTALSRFGEDVAQDVFCRGVIFVLVGPAGVGKNTIMADVRDKHPHLEQLPTVTTRLPRPNEQEGREHFFVDTVTFEDMVAKQALIEHQEVYPGKFYGTPRQALQAALDAQKTLIADIEVVGASKLKAAFPDKVVLIFIRAPTLADLEKRLRLRGNMSEEEIARRLERASFEMPYAEQCDYRVINDTLEQAVDDVCKIISEELVRRECA